MLHDEYATLAKGVDSVTEEQAKHIISAVLDKILDDINANNVDVWRRLPGQFDIDILEPFVRRNRKEQQSPNATALAENARGVLPWVAEQNEPIWLEDIEPADPQRALVNRLGGQRIEGRFLHFDPSTRALAAVPINFRDQFRGVLMVETNASDLIKDHHLDVLKSIAFPTGILIWKAEVNDENRKQTDDAIDAFKIAANRPVSPLNPYRTGFIARPFEPRFDLIGKVLEDAFRTEHVQATHYHHPTGSGLVMNEMLTQIASAHFGIADLTSLNENVLIEFGVMLSLTKPFVLLRDGMETDPLPFDISGFQYYRYSVEGSRATIMEPPANRRPLSDVVREFVQGTLMADPAFSSAMEWNG